MLVKLTASLPCVKHTLKWLAIWPKRSITGQSILVFVQKMADGQLLFNKTSVAM